MDSTGFLGTGFQPAPAAGQLDSDDWALTGMSEGAIVFGDTKTTGDFARGATAGDVSSGGLYALNYGSGDKGLILQPTSSDWNPGTITLRLQNNTGGSIAELAVAYDLLVLNNEDRSNTFNFSYSTDNVSCTGVSGLDYTSPGVQDAGAPVVIPQATTITGLAVTAANGSDYSFSSPEVLLFTVLGSTLASANVNLLEDLALEIYNPTSDSVDLNGYTVKVFNNGSFSPSNTQALSGLLGPGAVYVIANASADSAVLAQADITSTVTFYNGDDAVVLLNGGDTIDVIGLVGQDPGTNWAIDTLGATSEFTLVRKPAVNAGQKNWVLGAFEWLVYAQNNFSFLGSHDQDPCPVVCSTDEVPTGQSHTVLGTVVRLDWVPQPGVVACQVEGQRLPTGHRLLKTSFPLLTTPS